MYGKIVTTIQNKFNIDAHYFLSGGFWLLVAQAVAVLTSLGVAVLFAATLSENDYGTYRYVISLAVLISAFSLTGTGQSIMQAAARGYTHFLRDSTKPTLLYGLGISLIAGVAAAYYFLNENPTLAIGCGLIALTQPLTQLFSNAQSSLLGQSRFFAGSLLQITKVTFVSAVSAIALLFSGEILVLLAAFFTAQAVAALASYAFVRSSLPPEDTGERDTERSLSFAKHSSVRNWLWRVADHFDSVFVFQHLGAAELALYSVAALVPVQVRGSTKTLLTLLIPKYSQHDSFDTLKHSIPKRSLQFFLVLCLGTLGFVLIAPFVYSLLFPTYPEAVLYAQLLALSFPAAVVWIPFGALQALRLERELYWFQVLTGLMQIGLVFSLVFTTGLLGAVISQIATQYLRAALAYILLFKSNC